MNEEQDRIRELLGLANTAKEELRTEIKRTPWDITFLRIAIEISSRSHDAQTHNGCVLVRNNTVLSTGYNGFIRDIDDTVLPNLRPHKYPFMIHAEHNAILNCARNGISTLNATSYQTGFPCVPCLQFMYQSGITDVVYTDYSQNVMVDDNMDKQAQALLALINPTTQQWDQFPGGVLSVTQLTRLSLRFISKNDVLPAT